jgi:hypothetical protein
MVGCGLYLGEGKSYHYAVVQFVHFAVAVGILVRLFLYVFKLSMWCVSCASIQTHLFATVAMNFFIFKGKYKTVTEFRMFLQRFSPQTWISLKVAFSR